MPMLFAIILVFFFQVLDAMRVSLVGMRMAITRGCRKAGKRLIGSCIGIVRNSGMEPRLQKALTEHGLSDKYEDIPSDDSARSSAELERPSFMYQVYFKN